MSWSIKGKKKEVDNRILVTEYEMSDASRDKLLEAIYTFYEDAFDKYKHFPCPIYSDTRYDTQGKEDLELHAEYLRAVADNVINGQRIREISELLLAFHYLFGQIEIKSQRYVEVEE